MKNIWKVLILANLLAWIGTASYVVFTKSNETVYIDTYKLYNGFVMKKQLQKQLEETQRLQKQQLDSLRLTINLALANNRQTKDADKAVELKKQEYILLERQLVKEQEEIAERYDAQIWAQLNQYITDYGKEKKLAFIFGANGNGSVMYGTAEQDITEVITQYVNERHKGL
jgi:outer membrane protein